MSSARRVDIICTRPVWWQRRKWFQPLSSARVKRPLRSGRSRKVSWVLSAKSSAAGGGGGGGRRFFFFTLAATAGLGLATAPDGGADTAPDGGAATAPDGGATPAAGGGVGVAGTCA